MARRQHHLKHNRLYYIRRAERRRMLDEAHYDRERCETVATDTYQLLGILRGEVLFDSRGFVAPSLDSFSQDMVELRMGERLS